MNKDLLNSLESFLEKNIEFTSPFLLGLSGGCDSMALFHLLVDLKKKRDFAFFAVHVDHGWRKESAVEAEELKKICAVHSIPFFSQRLDFTEITSNLEEEARNRRLKYFSLIYEKVGATALLLAHQKEDVSETVLKRIFEGANLLHLDGIKSENSIYGMKILRPLLPFSKQELKKYLLEKECSWFEDSTNSDPKYLRSKMRMSLFPLVEEVYGKNIGNNLYDFANTSREIRVYLLHKIQPLLDKAKRACYGTLLILDEERPYLLEVKTLLQVLAAERNAFLSKSIIQRASDAIINKESAREFHCSSLHLYIDKGNLYLMKMPFKHFEEKKSLSGQSYESSCGTFFIEEDKEVEKNIKKSWQECWGDNYYTIIPEGTYSIVSYPVVKGNPSLEKKLKQGKVPSFLRAFFPYIVDQKGDAYDFFSGINSSDGLCLKMKIKYN